jgi:hypothetical protein
MEGPGKKSTAYDQEISRCGKMYYEKEIVYEYWSASAKARHNVSIVCFISGFSQSSFSAASADTLFVGSTSNNLSKNARHSRLIRLAGGRPK